MSIKIIAESAFNHNGDIEYLRQLADSSKACGADIFTVQVMNTAAFCVSDYSKYDIYKNTELSELQWLDIFDHCKKNEINLVPCVLDPVSMELCLGYGFELIKIHATDLTNDDILNRIQSVPHLHVLLETQCATILEIEYAIQKIGGQIEALFTGYSNYPTELEDTNLNVIDHFKGRFDFNFGYADHSLDTSSLPLMILAKGYNYIEKHITLSRNDRRFDWQVSLYPAEFSVFVNTLRHYELALGNGVKHPVKNELQYRGVMYKKVLNEGGERKRADAGVDSMTSRINALDSSRSVVAIIARLKSQRLPDKVILPFHDNALIVDLYNRLKQNCLVSDVVLATSFLPSDLGLVELAKEHDMNSFTGDPESVIDRLLSVALEYNASYIFRVTGDNPFSDPDIMNRMLEKAQTEGVDYVRVNGSPFGLSPELISVKYLWNLYLRLENTHTSEYLTWYVLNDKECRKAALDITGDQNREMKNLSIDYEIDYQEAKKLLSHYRDKKFVDLNTADVYRFIDEVHEEEDKVIKLPNGESVRLLDYLQQWHNSDYVVRERLELS
jgi:N,N'-diacetyllegionaminate synthase